MERITSSFGVAPSSTKNKQYQLAAEILTCNSETNLDTAAVTVRTMRVNFWVFVLDQNLPWRLERPSLN